MIKKSNNSDHLGNINYLLKHHKELIELAFMSNTLNNYLSPCYTLNDSFPIYFKMGSKVMKEGL